jgi:hypothetical protein
VTRTHVSIPIEIWNLSELHPNERVLLAEVSSFEANGKPCFIDNGHLAELLIVPERTARHYVSNLVNLGYLERGVAKIGRYNGRILTLARQNLATAAAKSCQDRGKNLPHTKSNTKSTTKSSTQEVVWPFDSDQFMNAWKEWEADRRERRVKPYTTRGLQTALHRLQQISEYNEGIAIRIISQSIANGWQGLFPLDNKRGNHQHDRPRGKDITPDDLARLVAKRYGPRFPPAHK